MTNQIRENYSLIVLLLLSIIVLSCSKGNSEHKVTNDILVDPHATAETVALFKNLQKVAKTRLLFGHQDDTAYGIGWWGDADRSDVKSVCGEYPAVYGWDLGDIHLPANLDGIDFTHMKALIRDAYARGGVITISMHLDNPVTGNDAWDNTPAVASILPGQSHHEQYIGTLELIANFLKDLKNTDGTDIPVILRPYHEHNHTWSWWGKSACSVDEYNALWRMTVEYFRDTQQIHHVLYAISPQDALSEDEYFERYPGDDFVDILGFDCYNLRNTSYVPKLGRGLAMIASCAEKRGKIAALTEVGVDGIPNNSWWTECLLAAIQYNDTSQQIAWALVWRNASVKHHFAPYPGHKSVADFMKFYHDPFTLFQNGLPDMYE